MTPIDFGVKGQGHIDLVGKNGFRSITRVLRPRNFKLGLMIGHDQQMTPIDFGVKGQGHIDLVGKNGFRSITTERLGLCTSNLE
jgi:hypothetical protein